MSPLPFLLFALVSALDPLKAGSSSYTLSNLQQGSSGFLATLAYNQPNPGPAVITNLSLNVTYVSTDSLRIRITDLNSSRWEVPVTLEAYNSPTGSVNFEVNVTDTPFGLTVTRNLDGKVVFNISPNALFQYNDQDIIMTNSLLEPVYVYGLGERVANFHLPQGIYTIFTRDQTLYDNGQWPGSNMYGHYPFYLALDPTTGNAFGGFLLNSNAMDVTVGTQSVMFETIGGVIDFFVFIGPTPLQVVQQYNALMGPPVLVPYWGLGWHQCRWGYNNLTALQTVVQNYQAYVIPLDVMWTDIDYMINYYDFTLDTSRYASPAFQNWIDEIHAQNMHFIPIVDAGVAAQNYFGYNDGTALNVWITAPQSSNPFVGQVWPGNASFVDWFNPNATTYWWNMLDTLRESIEFDGLWLDMNEASDFCNGECNGTPFINNFVYTPGGTNLNTKAIDIGAGHYGGLIEYNTHSLFGFMESRVTSGYLSQHLGVRPFIIARSSFPTHNRYASKWLGDNFSLWIWMAYSITGIFNFQMFGVPVIGADICGFNDNTTPELCSRWMQLGTLYPFSRDHNAIGMIPQEPYALGPEVLQNSILGIRNKYSLMNYFYTLMYQASLSPVGGMIWKPAFFNYPTDSNLYDTHSTDNFMIGDALIVHPCLTQGATQISAYFPDDIWYDWYLGSQLDLPTGNIVTLQTPAVGMINVHIRGGYILPRLDSSSSANTVHDLRSSNTTLVIALDAAGQASGTVIYDDGESLNSITGGLYTIVQYAYVQNSEISGTFTITVTQGGYVLEDGEFPFISMLMIYGCKNQPTGASVNGHALEVRTGFKEPNQAGWVYFDDQLPVDEAVSISIVF